MDSANAKDLGTKFKKVREEENFTQAQVAKKAQIHVNYYARIERGEVVPRWDIVSKVAKALSIKLKLPLEN